MSVDNPPSLEEFLAAPPEVVARVAPQTVSYVPAGSRRQATIEGIPLDDHYPEWSRRRILDAVGQFFHLGVQHVIFSTIAPDNTKEAKGYGDRVLDWVISTFSDSAMIAEYQRLGWRVQFLAPPIPALLEANTRLQSTLVSTARHSFWLAIVLDVEDPWRQILTIARTSGAQTQAAAIRALYGADIPPATMMVGFGKPALGFVLPRLLIGTMLHGYWPQRAGFRLTENMVRTMIYDYAYNRRTWEVDHAPRYAYAAQLQALWDTEEILGVGSKIYGYWYPNSFTIPALPDDPAPEGA